MKKDYPSHSALPSPCDRPHLIATLKEHYNLSSWLLEFFTNEELTLALTNEMEPDDYLISIYLTRTLN